MMLCLEHQYYTEFDEDFCRVEISTDGQNWTELASFDGKADYWQTTYIPLGDYTDELIRLRFHLDTDPSLNDPGWLIGDVRIVASTGAHTPQIPVVETKLTGNYPNPFNPTTQINFSLAEAGDVELSIYNVRGQKVRTLVKEELPAMDHSILWNGTDDNDQSVSSGVYFYKLKTGDYRSTKKMLLIK
jgi:hypothetical protein